MELLPGARFRIPVQNPAGAWGSGLVGRDHPGSLTIRVVHRFFSLGPWDFSPGTAGALRTSSHSNTRGIIEKKISIFSKKATWLLG